MHKNKIAVIAALVFTFLFLGGRSYVQHTEKEGLIIVTPKAANQIVSLQQLSDLEEKDELLLTYESEQTAVIDAINKKYDASVRYTNYNYPYVMGYPIRGGSYLTKESEDTATKYLAINSYGAFRIFGNEFADGEVTLNGIKYMLCGVIDDGEKSIIVYTHDAKIGASKLIARTDAYSSTEYIKNELKQAGITAANFTFTMPKINRLKVFAAVCALFGLFSCLSLLCLLPLSLSLLKKEWIQMQSLAKQYYLGGLIKKKSVQLIGFIGALACGSAIFLLMLYVLIGAFQMLYLF